MTNLTNVTNATSNLIGVNVSSVVNKTSEFINATKPYLNQKTLKGFAIWLWEKYSAAVPHWFTFVLLAVFVLYFVYDRLFVHPVQDKAMKGGIGFVTLAVMILIAWLIYLHS